MFQMFMITWYHEMMAITIESVASIAIIIFVIIASSYKYESRYHVLYRIIMLDVDVNKTGLLKLSHPKQGIYGSNQSDVPFTFKAT